MQVACLESEPSISVQLASSVEVMLKQVKDHYLAAFPKELAGTQDRGGWRCGVMQRLAEDYKINTFWCNGRRFEIAEPELQVLQSVLARLFGSEMHHLFRIIDSDHALG